MVVTRDSGSSGTPSGKPLRLRCRLSTEVLVLRVVESGDDEYQLWPQDKL